MKKNENDIKMCWEWSKAEKCYLKDKSQNQAAFLEIPFSTLTEAYQYIQIGGLVELLKIDPAFICRPSLLFRHFR